MAYRGTVAAAAFVIAFTVILKRSNAVGFYVRCVAYRTVISTMAGVLCVPAIFRPFSPANWCWFRHAATKLAWALGVRITLRHAERVPKDQRFVIVANHQSELDVLAMLCVWRDFHPLVPVLKRQVMHAGPMALFGYLSASIFVDSHNPQQSHQALKRRLGDVATAKLSLLVFPEGTRNTGRRMLPFKRGAFYWAIQCQVPILPVVFSHYSSVFNEEKKIYNNGDITMTVLPPVSTQGLDTEKATELAHKVQDIMQANIDHELAAADVNEAGNEKEAADIGDVLAAHADTLSGGPDTDDINFARQGQPPVLANVAATNFGGGGDMAQEMKIDAAHDAEDEEEEEEEEEFFTPQSTPVSTRLSTTSFSTPSYK